MARLRLPVRLRAAARRAAGDQRGITLIELLTSMAILGFVVASLGTLLVSGQKAEIDLNERFQAQTNARLALDLFRREVHNACDATVSSPATVTLYALAIVLAFVWPRISLAIYAVVAITWFVPDRRMERVLAETE